MMENYAEKAKNMFCKGYNCAQAVVLAFGDVTGLDEKTALTLSSSFGGGMGRMREVCGAVSGMVMVAGLLWGYDSPTDKKAKAEHYALIQRLAGEFRKECGAIRCGELLSGASSDPTPDDRTPQYYQKRPCAELVALAAHILAMEIERKKLPC